MTWPRCSSGGPCGPEEPVVGAALYVHGFSDYFFQTALADALAADGLAFHALDLRKSGRSRRPGQTAHHVTDLARYDEELDRALDLVAAEHPGLPVVVVAHSTGGLVVPLWLDRRRRAGRTAPVAGLVLNSPWFDLQGKAHMRGPVTQVLRVVGRVRPLRAMGALDPVYGGSLHTSGTGEWDFDVALKPLEGFAVTAGWLNAVRRGHARLHRGLDVGVPVARAPLGPHALLAPVQRGHRPRRHRARRPPDRALGRLPGRGDDGGARHRGAARRVPVAAGAPGPGLRRHGPLAPRPRPHRHCLTRPRPRPDPTPARPDPTRPRPAWQVPWL